MMRCRPVVWPLITGLLKSVTAPLARWFTTVQLIVPIVPLNIGCPIVFPTFVYREVDSPPQQLSRTFEAQGSYCVFSERCPGPSALFVASMNALCPVLFCLTTILSVRLVVRAWVTVLGTSGACLRSLAHGVGVGMPELNDP